MPESDSSATPDASKKTAAIKMVIFDVDGVLTDGTITIDDQGCESKQFHARDGLGIYMLHSAGYKLGIISGRFAEVVNQRAAQLKIEEVHQGISNKLETYNEIRGRHDLADHEVCFVGDDLIDLAVMRRVGFAAAPADAHPEVLSIAHHVTIAAGGKGAVREVVEVLLKANGQWSRAMEPFSQ